MLRETGGDFLHLYFYAWVSRQRSWVGVLQTHVFDSVVERIISFTLRIIFINTKVFCLVWFQKSEYVLLLPSTGVGS
jgi:hypothetical protein